jgi:hypothetical protein
MKLSAVALLLLIPAFTLAQTQTHNDPPDSLAFRPDPQKAVLLALVPGLGQIYNRNFWKLPLVFGAFMGCVYAVSWNNRNYTDYQLAYRDLLSPDPKLDSWKNLVPASVSDDALDSYPDNNPSFALNIRHRKDYFRRYRDLSIIVSAAVYALSIIDAYVDAQLFDFDISPSLALVTYPHPALALSCKFNF